MDKLKPYENNARRHPPAQIDKLTLSIQQHGFIIPILVDASYGVIAGHARLEAVRKAGLEQIPVIRIEHLPC